MADNKKSQTETTDAKKNVVSINPRVEGTRLFRLAGRPTKDQLILVYGENGPKMTWEQRAAAGVSAEKFQEALAEKQPKTVSAAA